MRALAEEVLIGKSGQAEYSAKQEKPTDVDVQDHLLGKSHQGRLDGRYAQSDAVRRNQFNFE